jgi:hypothetical protein
MLAHARLFGREKDNSRRHDDDASVRPVVPVPRHRLTVFSSSLLPPRDISDTVIEYLRSHQGLLQWGLWLRVPCQIASRPGFPRKANHEAIEITEASGTDKDWFAGCNCDV